ncbi:hypothetical protein Glove_168g244 [Diversispora epigaea]|uniref:Uncharacterized protein n=1 Tax=Diversispora epigaea TaxID=1348612 RepID=A0A397IPR0_9GLOM|nr:hypothetical protein Glove_168g244 [Diversispora epigaea]
MLLIAQISCLALHTLRPRFFSIQKRALGYEPPDELISPLVSEFTIEDLEALKVSFCPALSRNAVIPLVDTPQNLPLTLIDPNFDVKNIKGISDKYAKTFLDKLHDVTKNSSFDKGTGEFETDSLVTDLLSNVVDMNGCPLKIRRHPLCQLVTYDKFVIARPKFVVDMERTAMIADKHLKNKMLARKSGFGEVQIAGEILAQSVVIERWPVENEKQNSLDFAEPEKRKIILEALTKIREYLLR